MKKLLALTLIALSFATGFTCSKQAPEAQAPAQEEMAAPPAAAEEAAPAAPAEGAAAPAETAPPAETH